MEEFEFYLEGSGEPLDNFKQKKKKKGDIIISVF